MRCAVLRQTSAAARSKGTVQLLGGRVCARSAPLCALQRPGPAAHVMRPVVAFRHSIVLSARSALQGLVEPFVKFTLAPVTILQVASWGPSRPAQRRRCAAAAACCRPCPMTQRIVCLWLLKQPAAVCRRLLAKLGPLPCPRPCPCRPPHLQLIAGLAVGGLYGTSAYLINNGRPDTGFALGFASSMLLVGGQAARPSGFGRACAHRPAA